MKMESHMAVNALEAKAHQLIAHLGPSQLAAVVHLLEIMSDPVAAAASAAPPDDEPITDEDRSRLREGQDWLRKGSDKGFSMAQVLSDFGLKTEDF